jgi:hypothetical protein
MSYDMFTKAGNNACQALVNRIAKKIRGKVRLTPAGLQELYDKGREKIAERHEEVYDTEPRVMIAAAVNRVLSEVGYGFRLSYFGEVETI